MSYYYAKFQNREGILTREMTRIYFNPVNPSEKDDECIGVVVAKNPGAAKPTKLDVWTKLNLSKDRMLPVIFNAFNRALIKPRPKAYVRILNLFSVCNVDVESAYTDLLKIKDSIKIENAEADLIASKLIFIAWGNESYLDPLRSKWIIILRQYSKKSFYFSYQSDNRHQHFLRDGVPKIGDAVKHPQGLKQELLMKEIRNCFQ